MTTPERAAPSPWLDLTRPLDATTPVYAEPGYRDPPIRAAIWTGIPQSGFEVWRLSLGTQSGTHIDAPSHFAPGGATMAGLGLDALIGRYFHLSAAELADPGPRLAALADEPILFLDALAAPEIDPDAVEALVRRDRRVWIMAGEPRVRHDDPLWLHRRVAEAGTYLVEDLDPAAASRTPRAGEAIVMPLRLGSVSGSPVRVAVRAAAV